MHDVMYSRSLTVFTAVLVHWAISSGLYADTGAANHVPDRVTFSEHIAPAVFHNCYECHRPGEAAPFSLMSYTDVRKRADMILHVTQSRYMPPWHPVPGHGEFRDARRLTDRDLALLEKWVATGMEEGDPAQLPPLPEFPGGWRLGEPDLVVQMIEPFEIPADGPDIYRNFVVPLDLPEDQWLTAIEVRPTSRQVVHHVLFFSDATGVAQQRDAQDDQPGFRGMGFRAVSLGGWAVGATARKLPQNLARRLEKGSDLVLACHYHPTGKVEHEQTVVGLYFADQPPQRDYVVVQVPPGYGRRTELRSGVPAGEKDFRIRGEYTLLEDADLVTASGHAHYICESMIATATLPDGSVKPLFYIDDWDFNWQGQYVYQDPLRLPKGTVIKTELVYDNSAENPENPNFPPKRIRWGLQSTDEMGTVLFGFARDKKNAGQRQITSRENQQPAQRNQIRDRLAQLDSNQDGRLQMDEIPRQFREFAGRLDTDKNGALSRQELQSVRADFWQRFLRRPEEQ